MRVSSMLLLGGLTVGCGPTDTNDTPQPRPDLEQTEPSTPGPRSTSARCAFAVTLPFRRAPAPTPAGMLDQIATENRLSKVAVTASCADLDRITSTTDLFAVTSRGMLRHLGATVKAQTDVEHQGRRGIDIQAHVPADKPIQGMGWSGALDVRLRMFRSGLRLYQLVVLQSADNDDRDAVATAFFDSFELSADAPPPTPAPTWARQAVGPFTIEAPGRGVEQPKRKPQVSAEVRFIHDDGPTGYTVRVWPNALPSDRHSAHERLEAFLTLALVTEHSQLGAQTRGSLAGWSTLDLEFRPNLPIPEAIAKDNPAARETVAEFIEDKQPGDHLRLVMVENTVVELRAKLDRPTADVTRFLDSLQRTKN